VCRELTKLYEELWRGTVEQAAAYWSEHGARGEVTLVVGGAVATGPDLDDALTRAARLVDGGMAASQASRMIAEDTGVARRQIYEGLVHRRRGRAGDGD